MDVSVPTSWQSFHMSITTPNNSETNANVVLHFFEKQTNQSKED